MTVRRAVLDARQLEEVARGGPLPDAVAHYLVDVLRLGSGARVELSDGTSRVLGGRLEHEGPVWRLAQGHWLPHPVAPTHPITLLAGLLKPKRWRLVIEKSAELGVERIVPLLTQHVGSAPAKRDHPRLVGRWNRIALEASRQCRRAVSSVVERPLPLDEALSGLFQPNRLLAHTGADRTWCQEPLTPLAPTALLLGPEGGLTDPEVAAALDGGFEAISLGGYPLRAETATTVLLGLARDRLGFAARELEEGSCP